jgi:hypothetical protein
MTGKKGESQLSDVDIALYALYLLGGWHQRVHTEDVALKCFELAKSKFSWVKYPQFPDPAPARFALEQAKKKDRGSLVEGASERSKAVGKLSGWILTTNGIKWIEMNKARIEKALSKKEIQGDRLLAERKIRALKDSAAFKKFITDGANANISPVELYDSLQCTVNTPPTIIIDRIKQFATIAKKMEADDVKKYIEFIENRFAGLKEVKKL